MRIIYTLLLLFIVQCCFAQADSARKLSPVKITLRCSRSVSPADEPLFLVDGVLVKDSKGLNLNAMDIASIQILKGADAMAIFGRDAANGVIMITTKLTYKKIMIRDALDLSPVAAATISFNYQGIEGSLNYIADSNGIVFSNSWKKLAHTQMSVSAVGYKTYHRDTPGDDSVIYLQRDVKVCEEVMISQTYCSKRICCGGTLFCTCSGIWIKRDSVIAEQAAPLLKGFNIYPNPVKAGTSINIRFNELNSVIAIRVLDLDGKTLLQRPVAMVQKSSISLEIDSRWAAGIYFIQLLYENGRVAASQKIIIQ